MEIIKIQQEYSIVCDNNKCDYKEKNTKSNPDTDYKKYLNRPCPKCGENLLTKKDYIDYINMLKVINWINKYFGWIGIFIPKKDYKSISIHVHDGVTTIKEE